MSSMVDLASQLINDDYSHVSTLFRLIVNISDEPKDPLKAAQRGEVIKFLCSHIPEFDSFCDERVKAVEDAKGVTDDIVAALPGSTTH